VTEYKKPIPIPDDESRPFWEAARLHRLSFQRCQHCGTYAHPPVAFCDHCHNVAMPSFEFEPVSGRGKIVNWTVMREAMVSGFENDVPWIYAEIELDEQEGLTFLANLEDDVSEVTDRLAIGAPVEVTFHDITDTATWPYFKLTN
jgi:uncharacterized OB-fold protein